MHWRRVLAYPAVQEGRSNTAWQSTIALLPLERVSLATRVNVWFLTCGVGLVCRWSSWWFFALVHHKTQQTHGVSTFLQKNVFFVYRVWVIFFLPATALIEPLCAGWDLPPYNVVFPPEKKSVFLELKFALFNI